MKFPDIYRAPHPMGFPHAEGDPYGWFMISYGGREFAAMADGQTEWEHLSVSTRGRPPSWDEMCYMKRLFWDDEETVVQFHPPKSEYVNLAKNCLHLWRFKGEFPRPPSIMVGPR